MFTLSRRDPHFFPYPLIPSTFATTTVFVDYLTTPLVKRFQGSMLPRIVTSPFFVLPCLWVATLAVFALPMPTGGKDAAVVFGPQLPMIVDLHIFIAQMNTLEEHLLMGIGDTIIHANVSDESQRITNTTLIPRKFTVHLETLKKVYHTVPIGEARFKDEQDEQDVIKEMLQLKLPPFSHRGTCRDYISQVLQELKVRGYIIDPGVLRRYRKIYNERYEKVFKDYYTEKGIESGTI
ncbi:hypothetical protein C8R41DRAFT_923132 [Lentinula lateritia]|uniref:Uncharacterized protein n=1 Tax=Lentinula lateritia TaxID=40482 RepID=A0ABQ8V6P5_9AGAR|nr:hypothetical protein C8R41DRAFT_923132 [Lentinula lateritia]